MQFDSFVNKIISVDDICNARDARMERLRELSAGGADGFILVTLNIPGKIKNTDLYRRIFNQGIRSLRNVFERTGITYKVEHVFDLPTGHEGYVSFYSHDPVTIKEAAVKIEEKHPLGRIFDIDIFDKDIIPVKINRAARKCYICGRPGVECSRSRRHTLNDVLERIEEIAEKYFSSFYWNMASAAVRAMITEVTVSPKPGLVDSMNSGSHSDMDIFSFIDSSTALIRTFYRMAESGGGFSGENMPGLFMALREIGLAGEKIMYRATGGVNTQKGLIFSLGILSGAAGYILSNSSDIFTVELLCRKGGEIAEGVVDKDLKSGVSERKEIETKGEKLYAVYGITGARGEAESGFKTVLKALDVFQLHLSNRCGINQALLGTLVYLLGFVEDTNVLGRNGTIAADYVKQRARNFLDRGGIYAPGWFEELEKMDKDFINRNISPGGSADILVSALFLHYLKEIFADK